MTEALTAPLVTTDLSDGILTITLSRPGKKNALTQAMYTAIADALDRAMADGAVRVAVLQGSGGSFTAGNDLMDFMSGNLSADGGEPPVFRVLRTVVDFTKPLIAAVEGPAVGIGTTILLHCDLAVAHRGTTFSMPFVNLGLCPEAASSVLLPKIMGHARAAELLMLGDPFDAATALAYGLVNRVVDGDVRAEARALATRLAAKPPASVRLTKELMRKGEREMLHRVMQEEAMLFAGRLGSPEAQEAFGAFMERRQPDFSRFE